MKTLLAFAFATLACLVSASADIPAPKPVTITVNNLSAFPQYKFAYKSEDEKVARPIVDGQPFHVFNDATLRVQAVGEAWQDWEKVKYDWRGANITIKVETVQSKGGNITVTYKKVGGSADPTKRSAATGLQWVPLFTLAGMCTCALVVIGRRRKKQP